MERRTKIYKVVERGVKPDSRVEFNRLLMENLSVSGPLSALSGYTDEQFHLAITSTLQTMAESELLSEESNKLWNPLIAGLFRFIISDPMDEVSPQSEQQTKEKKTSLAYRNKSAAPSTLLPQELLSDRKEPPSLAKGKTSGRTRAKASKELPPNTPNRGKTPPMVPGPHVRTQLDVLSSKNEVPLFSPLSWIKCTKVNCSFCRKLFRTTLVTQCGNNPYAKCTSQEPCVPCGWFPHVGKTLWKILKDFHKDGIPFYEKPQTEMDVPCLECWDLRAILGRSSETHKKRKIYPSDDHMDESMTVGEMQQLSLKQTNQSVSNENADSPTLHTSVRYELEFPGKHTSCLSVSETSHKSVVQS